MTQFSKNLPINWLQVIGTFYIINNNLEKGPHGVHAKNHHK